MFSDFKETPLSANTMMTSHNMASLTSQTSHDAAQQQHVTHAPHGGHHHHHAGMGPQHMTSLPVGGHGPQDTHGGHHGNTAPHDFAASLSDYQTL